MKLILFLSFVSFLSINMGYCHDELTYEEVYVPTPPILYTEEILDFYSVKDPYGEFSNFALFPIEVEGVHYPTSEHYYQSQKYTDPMLQEKVRLAATPMEAALIGRDPKIPKRENWETHKDVAMEIAVRAKFYSHENLQVLLKSTNKALLFEHTKNDCYWGDCFDRTGKNKLGLLLMKIRSEL